MPSSGTWEKEIVTFDQAIYELYKNKQIPREEAISHADSSHNMSVKLRSMQDDNQPATGNSGLALSD
jgi:Tfp pilus assembly ATPase PilU